MRISVASGDSDIASAGIARCRHAVAKASRSPASSASSVRKPVTSAGGSSVIG